MRGGEAGWKAAARGLSEPDLPGGECLPWTGCTGLERSCLGVVGWEEMKAWRAGEDGAEVVGWMFIQRVTGQTRRWRGEDSNEAVHSTRVEDKGAVALSAVSKRGAKVRSE